jgi:hypothetical protein
VELAEELRTLQAGLAAPAKVHFVGFQMKAAHKSELNRLARRFGGSVREID